MDGLSAAVSVQASDASASASGRRLQQAGTTITITVVVPVPQGKDAAAAAKLAAAAAKAVATDREALRAILTLALPANVVTSLGMDALLDALVASTKVEATGQAADGADGPTAQVKVTQKIPGVKPSDLSTSELSSGERCGSIPAEGHWQERACLI